MQKLLNQRLKKINELITKPADFSYYDARGCVLVWEAILLFQNIEPKNFKVKNPYPYPCPYDYSKYIISKSDEYILSQLNKECMHDLEQCIYNRTYNGDLKLIATNSVWLLDYQISLEELARGAREYFISLNPCEELLAIRKGKSSSEQINDLEFQMNQKEQEIELYKYYASWHKKRDETRKNAILEFAETKRKEAPDISKETIATEFASKHNVTLQKLGFDEFKHSTYLADLKNLKKPKKQI